MANCPNCDARLAGDEIFCLACGERLVPEPEPATRWGLPVAIVVVIAALAVGGTIFALEQVESDAKREATKPAPVVKRPAPEKSDEKPTDVAAWPAGTSAYTVVLETTDSEVTARARATAAVGAGVPAGVLDTDSYPTLEPGQWVLYAGRYDTREEAAEEAIRYAAAGFPQAAATFVSDGREPAS